MILLGVTFDFGNVLVIPLLCGIGVDSSIHLIQAERENPSAGRDLLGGVTVLRGHGLRVDEGTDPVSVEAMIGYRAHGRLFSFQSALHQHRVGGGVRIKLVTL